MLQSMILRAAGRGVQAVLPLMLAAGGIKPEDLSNLYGYEVTTRREVDWLLQRMASLYTPGTLSVSAGGLIDDNGRILSYTASTLPGGCALPELQVWLQTAQFIVIG